MVTLSDESTWPTPQVLGLDDSQYNAYKMALTTEFVTIQGPPGTGKTFLGLNIATTILQNFHSTSVKQRQEKNMFDICRPILVVCFTNHALDQFLEGLLPFTEQVVRIGGQSKNKNIAQYNLKKLRRYNSGNNHHKQQLRQSSLVIEALQALLESLQSSKGVFDVTHHQLTFLDSYSDYKVVIQFIADISIEDFLEPFVFGGKPPLLNFLLMTKYSSYSAQISQRYGYEYSHENDKFINSKQDFSFNTMPLEYSCEQLMFEVNGIKSDLNNGTLDQGDKQNLEEYVKRVLYDVNELKVCRFYLYFCMKGISLNE